MMRFLSGCDPGNAERGHDRLRAGAEHPEHFHVRHVLVDFFGQKHFRFMQKTGDRSAGIEKFKDLLSHFRIVASENRRPACLQEIDVGIAVLVGQVRAVCRSHAHRERLVEGQVVLHAARDIFLSFFVDGMGLPAFLIIVFQDDVVVIIVVHFPDRLACKIFELSIDFIRIIPAADAAVHFFRNGLL
jgi:predicted methyltransferase